jgi:4-diphosphocytidyl-2-C-methyl-D-erythritol kinase
MLGCRAPRAAFLAPSPLPPRPPRVQLAAGRPAAPAAAAGGRRAAHMSGAPPLPQAPDWDLTLASPSKINLFLRVLRRRDDGYHELASLFQAISLRDELSFAVLGDDADADVLECSAPGVPTDGTNLVLRALETFRRRTGVRRYFKVRLEKRVPAQAGLGGGSANAATALWGANELCGKPASTEELAAFGAEFGSDVSFFFSMGTAYCTGRGEVLRGVDRLMPQTLWLIKPTEGLSTGAVFSALEVEGGGEDPEELLRKLQTEMLNTCDAFVNDLEAPSFKLEPRLGEIKAGLQRCGFCRVLMSGSGTAFFCLGEPDADHFGDRFVEQFSAEYNVRIMRAMFIWRKHPDYWYMQQPTDEELLEWRTRRDAGKEKTTPLPL